MCGEGVHWVGEVTETHGGQELGLWPSSRSVGRLWVGHSSPLAAHPLRPSRAFLLPLPQARVSLRPAASVHLLAPPRGCTPSIQVLGGDRAEAELAAGQDLIGHLGKYF